MEAFKKLESTAASLQVANIDTDQIIPARFLKTPRSTNHGEFLFHDVRRSPSGELDPKFILNTDYKLIFIFPLKMSLFCIQF